MAFFGDHRILLASLFLPQTINVASHESPRLTPTRTASGMQQKFPGLVSPTSGPVAAVTGANIDPLTSALATTVLRSPARLISIVDDLSTKAQSKVETPQPQPDVSHPFPFPSVPLTPGLLTPSGASSPRRIGIRSPTGARPSPSFRVPSGTGNTFSPSPIATLHEKMKEISGMEKEGRRRSHSPSEAGSCDDPHSALSLKLPTPASTSPVSTRLPSRKSRSSSLRRSNSIADDLRDSRRGRSRPSKLSFEIAPCFHGNVGLHKAIASVEEKIKRRLWIGVLDLPTDEISQEMRLEVDFRMGQVENVPVWVGDDEFRVAYDDFCHQVLWPSLHYAVPDAPKTKVFYETQSFKQYKTVNEKFAEAIVSVYEEGDIIWVNDYHLCLVPQLVRQKLPNATIGFFLHVAWPSSEIFRCLAVRTEILRGMLGSDLIGFQTHNFARHFRQTVSRILSVEAVPKGIQLENSFVDVAVFPIGIDVLDLKEKRKDPEVKEWVKTIKQRYEGKKLIVGRDKLDGIAGVRHKIIAFDHFLEKHPEFQGKVVMIQIALSTTEQNELQASISNVVARVNSRFSSLTYQPVVLLHTQDITFSMYLGLLTAADAFMVASLREGMALRTHEYVECQEETKRPLILSEFTGSYSYSGFRSCIAFNPWDYKNTADAIYQALIMSDEEANSRWQDLHRHVNTQTAQAFVSSFLTKCIRVHQEHIQRHPDSIPFLSITGLQQLIPKYTSASKRLIMLDLESTLWAEDPKAMKEAGFVPPQDVVDTLKQLVTESKNTVWVLSGLPVAGALEKLSVAVPGLGLVAENGCFTKEPNSSEWSGAISMLNLSWKSLCVEILGYFTERTPGSYVEERGASVVWRFLTGQRDEQEIQWARRQAAEAQNHVWDSLGERFGLRIIPGATSFLVLPKGVSRSRAVGPLIRPLRTSASVSSLHVSEAISRPHLPTRQDMQYALPALSSLHSVSAGPSTPNEVVKNAVVLPSDVPATTKAFGFILLIGSDETIIRRLNHLEGDGTEVLTCSTGKKGSDAKWRLDPKGVLETLRQLPSQGVSSG